MSRHAQLPPRCPLQKKPMAPQANFSISSPSCKDIDFHPMQRGHYKSNSILEEQPAWLNDLLSDIDSISNDSCEPDDGLESSCISVSGVLPSDFGDASPSAGEISNENKPMKRHPGQRSRARKLQYISELERTVDVLQNLGSELAVRVASLIQQHAALLLENNTLKQRLLRMKQEKFIVDVAPPWPMSNMKSSPELKFAHLSVGAEAYKLQVDVEKREYQSLKKEVDRLKTGLAISANNKVHTKPRSHSDAIWNMLDMRKLDLN
ncbi:hypothetical protein DH2020_030286 [Rehmannia glutinosa]|uniref:Uncharacterized protein n=1 Tax=Rehmannia glutinosa TaxID=99300 RepID=A0ABR0VMU3_REHGL